MQTALSVRELSNVSTTAPPSREFSTVRSRDRRTLDSDVAERGIRLRFDSAHQEAGRSSFSVEHAIHGNHLAIQAFLQRTLHRPSSAEFNSSTMRPGYEPSERLVIKSPQDRTIGAHVQLESQTIRFGRSEIPVGRIRDFAILPEYQHRELDDQLLAAVETEAKKNGAMLMLARGENHRFLARNGWSMLGSDPVSLVSPQRLLGQLPAPMQPESPFYADKMPQWEVRIGRLTDIDALSSLYDAAHADSYGGTLREHDRWSWLISKGAHNRIYLFTEDGTPLAYVVVRGASVIELVDMSDDGRGAARLLERVGADAIDQGRHSLKLHCPLTSPVHTWADQAGGQLFAPPQEDCWMVKILSKRTLLRRLAHEMHRRKPKALTELGIRIGSEELLIRNGVRSMKVTRGSSDKHHIGLTNRAAVQLFLGYRTASELHESQELIASGPTAVRAASELFPAVMLWRTQWDDAAVLTR